jgi:hypothetical protein
MLENGVQKYSCEREIFFWKLDLNQRIDHRSSAVGDLRVNESMWTDGAIAHAIQQ